VLLEMIMQIGLYVNFWLGAGSNYSSGTLGTTWSSYTAANVAVGQVNLADSTDNEWYITGVQLEAGTTASDFEFLPVDVNLNRCQRYFQFRGGSFTMLQ
jgi:phage gp37-like protein